MNQVELTVGGMGCSGCVDAVTKAVQKVAPSAEVAVDLASGKVSVRSDVARAVIASAIEKAGYDIKS